MKAHQMEYRRASPADAAEYEAVLFAEADQQPVGYALYRREPDYVYLRQFFIQPESRRRGVGRAAIDLLRQHEWGIATRVRVEVLVNNAVGVAFWRAVGFVDYCLTLELDGASG
jgi:ribosomal protein S18 acetylase RimI-like enzyme